jgi:Multiubiquitin
MHNANCRTSTYDLRVCILQEGVTDMTNEHQPPGQSKSFNVVVNGTQEVWTDHRISYEQVVQLAFPGGSTSDSLYTVSYANPHGRDGTLAPGQDTEVRDGMIFNVSKTNRS